MNKLLQESIRRQKIREVHKRVIRKARLLKEEQANLYTTFVQPFTDIIDAAKLTGQDILNSVKLQFDLLFTLGTKGMDEAMADYDKRKDAIGKKWDPIMKRTEDALQSGDADLIALVMAPHFFLASEAAMASYDKAEDLYDYLDDSGWRIPLAGALFGGEAGKQKRSGSGGASGKSGSGDSGGEEKSLLSKLAGLFYFEGSWREGDLILEQEEQEDTAKKAKPDLQTAMEEYFVQTGLKEKFSEDAKELLKIQETVIQKVLDAALPRLTLITALTQTADVDEFVLAIDQAEQEGLDLQATGMDTIKTEISAAAEKLAQSEEFQKQTAETSGVKLEDMSTEDMLSAAKKVAFVNAKQSFDDKSATGKEKVKEEALAKITEKSPNETNAAALKSTKEGIALLKLIEDAKQKIANA